jgi:betaine-aldehyde dehydrogenase
VTGDGATAGNALTSSTLIDKIAFTGGTTTGKIVAKAAAENLKKVTLELGGKNPVLIFNDANMDLAIDWGLFAAFANSGQVCTAGSRILIQEDIYDQFVARFLAKMPDIKVGNGMDEGVTMGPIVSETQLLKIEKYIEIGKKEETLAFGGNRLALNGGYFVEPTVFTNVSPDAVIANEEIFGPVVALIKFKDEAEAIKIANDTIYGLGFGVFTQDVTRAHRVTRAIRAGIGWVNWYHPTFNEMPWGGYKQSGYGRELGLYGIEAYMEVKQININLDTEAVGWY